ncbi:MAG: tandem-95 repeat protein, partial [Verrucomicrobiaceae bacterium]
VTDPAPVANGGEVRGDQGQELQIYLSGHDPQGDQLEPAIVSPPAHGRYFMYRFSNSTFALIYNPAAGFYGTDEITFTMADAGGNVSAPKTISITVNRVNLPPVATALTRSQSGLLPTMALTLAGTDPEDDPLTVRIVTPPSHGILSGSGTDFVYTPATVPFEGTDSFSYVVNDGESDSAPATVSLSFIRDARPPVVRADFATAYRGLSTRVNVLGNDADDWGNEMFVYEVSQPAHGTVSIFGDDVMYVHNGDEATEDRFTYSVSNFSGVTSTETVFVTIRSHVITLPSLADSGPGTLREAVEIVNRHAGMSLAPDHTARAEWTVQLPPVQVGSSLSRDYSLDTVGEDDPSLGASALVVKGLVSFVSMGAPVEIRRSADSVPMRLFSVAPYARATFQGIKLHDGIARLGGAIHNQGELTLRNSVLEGNEARAFYDEPGLGGAVYTRNGSVQLDGATFRDNKADDGGGIYQIAEGTSASVTATRATFIGNTGNDFRSTATGIGQADFHAVDLTA